MSDKNKFSDSSVNSYSQALYEIALEEKKLNDVEEHVISIIKLISESEDFTFKPRFFSHNSILLNSEYRKVTKNSNHIIDVSYKNKASSSDSKTHFFSNSKFDLVNAD